MNKVEHLLEEYGKQVERLTADIVSAEQQHEMLSSQVAMLISKWHFRDMVTCVCVIIPAISEYY